VTAPAPACVNSGCRVAQQAAGRPIPRPGDHSNRGGTVSAARDHTTGQRPDTLVTNSSCSSSLRRPRRESRQEQCTSPQTMSRRPVRSARPHGLRQLRMFLGRHVMHNYASKAGDGRTGPLHSTASDIADKQGHPAQINRSGPGSRSSSAAAPASACRCGACGCADCRSPALSSRDGLSGCGEVRW
jgi:hypothetical protein